MTLMMEESVVAAAVVVGVGSAVMAVSGSVFVVMLCFLKYADVEKDSDQRVRNWVAKIRDVAYGTEDVIDNFIFKMAQKREHKGFVRLFKRSMIQAAMRKCNGRIKTIRVHDLLRELSISKAKEDQFLDTFHGDVNAYFLAKAQRISLHSRIPPTAKNTSRIRSLLFFDFSEPICLKLKKFKLLQVLDLKGVHLALVDSSIGNLIHLRYLDLKITWLKKLPSLISNLCSLQTLGLRSTLIDPIPVVIWKMKQLRHLYLNKLREMVVNPTAKAMSLENLQTLLGLRVGESTCIEQRLMKLSKLKELELHGHLIQHEEALGQWIINLKDLQCLKMHTRRTSDITTSAIPKCITLSNHFHLYKLHLNGFKRRLFEMCKIFLRILLSFA
ncbi:hypothetical protein EZV62_024066 [Acer yangbiense]|uniref:Uncharacterized protein n=1 Tax=Acer yangbiense TaxID=1000413 RepID=A0A5C7H529_9ROSI|nr:hypothetical protein EZV62_024066 [Acer yangbiense]